MTVALAVELVKQCLMTALWVSLPLLLVGLVAGVVVSLVQLVTSLQDPAFGAVPRLGAFLAAFLVFLPWMFLKLMAYTTSLWEDLSRYAR